MSVWAILKNIGVIISFFKSISGLFSFVAQKHEMPPAEMLKNLLDQAEELLDRGVIDLPNVDEAAISEALKQIEEKIFGSK
jgi:hypothetical protein